MNALSVEDRGVLVADVVHAALDCLNATQRELAPLTGMTASHLCSVLARIEITPKRQVSLARALMVLAVRKGWGEDAVWALNEHDLLGLGPELDRARLLAEIYARADEGKVSA